MIHLVLTSGGFEHADRQASTALQGLRGLRYGAGLGEHAEDKTSITSSMTHRCVPLQIATDMGGPNAPRKVDEGIQEVLKVMHGVKPEDSGSFLNFTGEKVPF